MILQNLQSCGLTKSEAQVYLALLQKKEFIASEISSIVPVGRTRIYEIIPILIAKGVCTEIQRNNKKVYCAIEPKAAMQNLEAYQKQQLEEEFAKKTDDLHKQKEIFKAIEDELSGMYSANVRKTDVLDYIEILKDRNQIKEKWLSLQKKVKSELIGFSKAPYSLELPENIKHEKKIIKKKVAVRGIYEYKDLAPVNDKRFITLLEAFEKLGEEVRVVESLPMKLMVFDEKITMISLNDPISMMPSITAIIISHPDFAYSLKKTFESFWMMALPLKDFKKSRIS